MPITKKRIDTAAGHSDCFNGAVNIDAVAAPSGGTRLRAIHVPFTPAARTAAHPTPNRQPTCALDGDDP